MDHQKSYLSTIQEIRARLEEENAQLILTSHGSKSEDLDDATAKLLQDRNMRRMHAETVAFERKQARNPSRYNVVQASPSEFSLHWQTMTLLQKDKALEDFVDCEFASLTRARAPLHFCTSTLSSIVCSSRKPCESYGTHF